MANLEEYLSSVDEPTLQNLIGQDIIEAVDTILDVRSKSALIKLVSVRFRNELLGIRAVRECIVNTLPVEKVQYICTLLQVVIGNQNPWSALNTYGSSRSVTKINKLVNALDLPAKYRIQTKAIDERKDHEIITNIYGKKAQRRFLHPFQKSVKDEALKRILSGQKRFLIHMPTGSGKTATALELAVDVLRSPYHKKLITWVVNDGTLAEQAFQTFKELWGQKGDQSLSAGRFFSQFSASFQLNDIGFVCVSFQKFNKALEPDSQNHQQAKKLIANTGLLIVDEAHTAPANTFSTVINRFTLGQNTQLIGLSATPARQNSEQNQNLRIIFGQSLISIKGQDEELVDNTIEYLQQRKYLARINHVPIDTNIISDEVDEEKTCRMLAKNTVRNEMILNQMKDAIAKKEPTLVFACTAPHVYTLMLLAEEADMKAEHITQETSPIERERILNDFRNGDLPLIINFNILATGVDVPNVRRIVITRPVGSMSLYSQIMGRALRGPLNGGDSEVNTVVSYRDNLKHHGNASTLFESFFEEFFNETF
jgi:DNA repair protein RadD